MGKRGARLMIEERGKYFLYIDKGSILLTKARSSKTSHDHPLSSPVRVNKLAVRSAQPVFRRPTRAVRRWSTIWSLIVCRYEVVEELERWWISS